MWKYPLLFCSVVLLAGCGDNNDASSLTAQQKAKDREYAVYSLVIKSLVLMANDELVVVKDSTIWFIEDTSSTHTYLGEYDQRRYRRFWGLINPDMKQALDQETLEDFLVKNQQAHPLVNRLNLGIRTVLVSQKELAKIFWHPEDEDGDLLRAWKRFYTKYPNAQGILELSRVGFNHEMNQAFLYVGNSEHILSGAGFYVLLVKKGNSWKILYEENVWIS